MIIQKSNSRNNFCNNIFSFIYVHQILPLRCFKRFQKNPWVFSLDKKSLLNHDSAWNSTTFIKLTCVICIFKIQIQFQNEKWMKWNSNCFTEWTAITTIKETFSSVGLFITFSITNNILKFAASWKDKKVVYSIYCKDLQ